MQSSSYGAPLAGGSFDLRSFVTQPQTILRFLSWIFAIVVFATITAEGYINLPSSPDTQCVFNGSSSACGYAVGIGLLAFLDCVALIILDAYFPQISNAKERKYIVIGDCVFSGVWTILWFICFCVLSHQWSKTVESFPGDVARTAIAFSFFSIFSWGLLFYFAHGRYQQGVTDFNQEYRDPANDTNYPFPPAPYPSSYQQSGPSTSQEQPGDYQPPVL